MDRAPMQRLPAEEHASRFRQRNNREPRNANELVAFSKKIQGVQPLAYGEARAYFRPRSPADSGSKLGPAPKSPAASRSTRSSPSSATRATYQIGDEVMLTKERTGMIKFVGEVEFSSGLWYGIELHDQFVGKCDGTREGTRYFMCGPKRGMFVQERKIRRKMTRQDHARKESWIQANAQRNSRAAGVSSGVSSDADTQSREASVEEEKSHGMNGRRMASPKTSTRVAPTHQSPSPINGHAYEQQQQSPESGIVHIDDLDYYPAKSGDNLLQFAANQADLTLRSDLLDLYVNPTISPHFRVVFEDLKQFSPRAQHDLLLGDLLPRMKALLSS